MRLARTVIATLLLVAIFLAAFHGASVAGDTAKQAVESATRELQHALDEHRKISRDHVLLERQVADLRERKRVALERLQETPP